VFEYLKLEIMGGPRALKLKLIVLVTDDWGLMFESPKTGNSKSQQEVGTANPSLPCMFLG
jgi:hypothetical protein